MRGKSGHGGWVLFLFLLVGIVAGSFAAHYTQEISWLNWLAYGRTFGVTSPVTVSLGVLSLTVGFTVQINIGGAVGMLLGYACCRLTGG